MPVVNKALVRNGFKDIRSIVTTFDSGGDSGRMRTDERGKILAFSDYWRALTSLWNDGEQKELWENMLRYRDGRSRNFGNIFFQFMSEKVGNLSSVDKLFSNLAKADLKGEVVPVALNPADICFRTKSGKKYYGEHQLDELRMSLDMIKKIWLSKKVKANPEAIKSMIKAEVIIICPGSMYGSVLVNFLPLGMKEAYLKSKAKKILMVNIMSVANENEGYDQDRYIKTFERYLGKKCLDLVIMADLSKLDNNKLKKALDLYELEHSKPIIYKNKSKVKTIMADIALIETENYRLRHSEEKLAKLFQSERI